MTNRLISFSDITAYMDSGYGASDSNASALNTLLDNMTAIFESYLNRTLSEDDYTESFFISGSTIPVSALPVSEVASVSVSVDGTEYTSDDYDITPGGIRMRSVKFDGTKQVTVEYTGGYAVDGDDIIAVPDDIKQAARVQITHEFKRKDQPAGDQVYTAVGHVSSPGAGLLKSVKNTLYRYIHPWSLLP